MEKNTQTSKLGAPGLKVRTAIRGGKIAANHIRPGLKVKTAVKAGKLAGNRSRGGLALGTAAHRRR